MTIHEKPPAAFPFVRSEGGPYEVGRAHGAAFGEQVLGSIELYKEMFDEVGMSTDEALTYVDVLADGVRAFDPALAEEMEGIAAGADVDPRLILMVNLRTDIIRMKEGEGDTARECTTAAILPQATANGHTLLAQNWDQRGRMQANTVIIEQHTTGEPALLFLTEAGSLFRHGLNDLGVGVVGNALRSDQEAKAVNGMPTPVARRRALRTGSLAEAQAAIDATPRAHSGNHIVADATGVAVDLETVPGRVFAVDPTEGIVVHANHFVNEEAVSCLVDEIRPAHPTTVDRYCNLRDALAADRGTLTVEAVMEALRNHVGFPKSVCSHTQDPASPKASWTLASSVIDLTERRMWTAPGPACIGTYTEYSFS